MRWLLALDHATVPQRVVERRAPIAPATAGKEP